jgi:hypothetical protein
VALECERRGLAAVVDGCAAILDGSGFDASLVIALAGAHGLRVVSGGAGGPDGYWPKVWAARALLYVWDARAIRALRGAANDESWRVREMVAKVTARHRVSELVDEMVALRTDGTPRVRFAAERALRRLT